MDARSEGRLNEYCENSGANGTTLPSTKPALQATKVENTNVGFRSTVTSTLSVAMKLRSWHSNNVNSMITTIPPKIKN